MPPGVRIKWPNDLIADGAKLAGILLERQSNAVILGFGVNLAHHPDLPERPATSLKALAGAAPEPAVFAETLAEIFARWLARWRAEGHAPVLAAWLAAAHPIGTAADHTGRGRPVRGPRRLRRAPAALGGRQRARHSCRRRLPAMRSQ